MHQDIWLPPNTAHSKVVGRFFDQVHEYTNKDGEKCERTVTFLEVRIPGCEASCQLVKDNPDGRKMKAEYSAAWAHYEKTKAAMATAAPPVPTATEFGVRGTPIEELNFIGKDRLAMLKLMGFLTAEQVRDMSDAVCNQVGFGAKDFRRKAAEHLLVANERKATERAEQGTVNAATLADLARQLAEANAKIAELTAVAKTDAAPAPRKRKPAEAQAEA